MSVILVNGANLHFEDRGRGEPLVFVHGSASDWRTWDAQLDEFARRHRAIAYSRRYHWPNDPIPAGADYSMAEHVQDLETLLRKLDTVPADLVAHSYGACVALLLAIQSPHLVRRLVLSEPPALTLFVSNQPRLLEILKCSSHVRTPPSASSN